jgi:RNA polymerase sigma-70 factor, ECF subfamily
LSSRKPASTIAGPEPLPPTETEDGTEPGNFRPAPRVQSADAVSPPDQHLISECLSGRPEAFGQLVVRYQDRLYHTLMGMLGSADEAQDAAQDAFVHAFSRLDTFRGQSAFYSWLFRIAVNAAVSRKRKAKRAGGSIDAAREQTGLEPVDGHPASEPSYAMEVSEKQRLVRTALSELSDEFRTVLVLKEMEDLKYEEIAEIVGCPVGTVRSRIHRARAELRARLRVLLKTDD